MNEVYRPPVGCETRTPCGLDRLADVARSSSPSAGPAPYVRYTGKCASTSTRTRRSVGRPRSPPSNLLDRRMACRDAGIELARKTARHDLAAGGLLLHREISRASAEVGPKARQRHFAGGIVLDRIDLVHEVVTCGPVGFPGLRQRLAAQHNLLHKNVGSLAGTCSGQRRAQLAAIPTRIAKAVDVVDADAINELLLIQAQDQRVRGSECLIVLLSY